MPLEKVPAFGWKNVARLINDHAEVLVTLDVGPRILSYRLTNGENVLRIFEDQAGKSGEDKYVVRGGHRVWVSPESDRTYTPDNGPVRWVAQQPLSLNAITPAETKWGVRKEMNISLGADSSAVIIQHRAVNEGKEPITIASWGLTIMAPGGWQIIPQPPLGEHGKEFLPNRVIVPWTYTDLSDDRWRIGRRFWILNPKKGGAATKLGFAHRERWVAYVVGSSLFIKSFEYDEGAAYPDLGCNYETFSKDDFIELESLSPLRRLEPSETVSHTETWHLFGDILAPNALDEAALERWLQPYLAKTGLP
jgi:hypothetical protein